MGAVLYECTHTPPILLEPYLLARLLRTTGQTSSSDQSYQWSQSHKAIVCRANHIALRHSKFVIGILS